MFDSCATHKRTNIKKGLDLAWPGIVFMRTRAGCVVNCCRLCGTHACRRVFKLALMHADHSVHYYQPFRESTEGIMTAAARRRAWQEGQHRKGSFESKLGGGLGEAPCAAHLSPEKRRGRVRGWQDEEDVEEEEESRGKSVPLHAHYHLFIWKTSLHISTPG